MPDLTDELNDLVLARQALWDATNLLGSYLIDNTEEVFEEDPDVDDIRYIIDEQSERLHRVIIDREKRK